MDRIDIIEAHLAFCDDYHAGQFDRLYKRGCRIRNYYTPSPLWRGYKSLSIQGKWIYNQLEKKAGLK